ncbi:MAG: sugar transferase [Acidobacteriota bacterium]|nr:sugar transferase [Acidobacteriota bacterium]
MMNPPQTTKRAIDVIIAALVLLLTLPLTATVALWILIVEGWPVFYVSRRYVSATRAIPVYKFRSMVRDAKSSKYALRERFMRDGFLDIPRDCEVYTPIGRLLERTQIVELPQMLNIILHGMSLIGNRPLPHENIQLLQRFDGWEKRFSSPAGISGITQVVGKLGLQPEQRLSLEAAYSNLYQSGNILYCDLLISLYTLRFIAFSIGLPIEEAFELAGGGCETATAGNRSKAASGAL